MEVRAKKHLGQHFLTDLSIAQGITEALTAEKARCVLEVGPGMGVLTQYLIPRETDGRIKLAVAEIDTESVVYLRRHYPNLNIIEGDFLQMDLAQLYPAESCVGGVSIIGNFPYNISSQIFFKVLDYKDIVPEIVGMLQKEVAVRLASKPGSKAYGILSVLLQAYYDIEYLFTVPPSVFSPPPKVQSAVIRVTRNGVKNLDCDEVLFKRIIKGTFIHRRKMVRNSLLSTFPMIRTAIAEGRTEAHPFFELRPEALSVAQFVELTNWVESIITPQ